MVIAYCFHGTCMNDTMLEDNLHLSDESVDIVQITEMIGINDWNTYSEVDQVIWNNICNVDDDLGFKFYVLCLTCSLCNCNL